MSILERLRPRRPAIVPPAPTPDPLARRRDELATQVAELQFDLGGLTYEMAIRDHFRLDVLLKRAAELQQADGELGELDRLLRAERTAETGACPACDAPHSRAAAYCWQCGGPLLTPADRQAPATDSRSADRP
jgi:hypothetical protein